ncbi:hypothetical protein BD779DRAFT_1611184 [Infundibulicybe gibba]|nr:hypothetical protein BD779DRAFT_1611184 [Infundibulicybe gibba]
MHSLDTIPQEVLEHIALFSATETLLGPPSALLPLLTVNRKIYSSLSPKSNHHLYALIFAFKFDLKPAFRRLVSERTTPAVLTAELQHRFLILKRIISRVDASISSCPDLEINSGSLHTLLFHSYLLVLENEDNNIRQLRDYAQMDGWLKQYWFHSDGASGVQACISRDAWPANNQNTSLAMWLFWFFLRPEEYAKQDMASWNVLGILKLFALAAHKYNLTSPSWVDFVPSPRRETPNSVTHYSAEYRLVPPPLATPAILSFLTLVNHMTEGGYSTPITPSNTTSPGQISREWECEWGRCISLGQTKFGPLLTGAFRPGSIDGVWEGLFTYTEFTAYAALLSGAPPLTLQKSMVVRHRQTWKLREHHLISSTPAQGFDCSTSPDVPGPLPAGDPLRSYFPTGTQIREHQDGIDVQEPGGKDGHSAWGQFNLVGRVRPCDGFVSLSKEYVDGDRGKWLYRGYLVGDVNGNLAGRWRDTLSPADVPGYEGCFTMSRRR